jgi:YVTN family beta-propeller protein
MHVLFVLILIVHFTSTLTVTSGNHHFWFFTVAQESLGLTELRGAEPEESSQVHDGAPSRRDEAGLHKVTTVRRPVAAVVVDDQLWVGNQRTGTISSIGLADWKVRWERKVASSIADMVLISEGEHYRELIVLDAKDHTLRTFQLEQGELLERATVALPRSPIRLAWSSHERLLAVTSLWSRRVTMLQRGRASNDASEIETAVAELSGIVASRTEVAETEGTHGESSASRWEWRVRDSLELPFAPRELVFDNASRWLAVADGYGGRLAIVDCEQFRVHRCHQLKGHHLHGLANRHDGQALWVSMQQLHSYRSTTHEEVFWGRIVRNVMVELSWERLSRAEGPAIGEEELPEEELPVYFLGRPNEGTGDPGFLLTLGGETTLVALSGIHQIAVRPTADAPFEQRDVGRRPVAMVPDPSRRWVYVVNQMDDTVSVLDLAEGKVRKTVPLGPLAEPTLVDRGEALFYDATLSLDGWYSCHSCHTDGHTTGLLNDNLGDDTFGAPKRILSLLGGGDTGPWAWHGQMATLEEQVAKSIRDTMQGESATEEQVAALTAFLRQLAPPPSGEVLSSIDAALRNQGAEIFWRVGARNATRRRHTRRPRPTMWA